VIGGVGSEIASLIMAEAFDYIEAPFVRLGAAEQAIPCSPGLERACFPNVESIVAQAEATCSY
jgi:pyruvate/2-oxoglutarate/acetoin dehydrogenase E1 component